MRIIGLILIIVFVAGCRTVKVSEKTTTKTDSTAFVETNHTTVGTTHALYQTVADEITKTTDTATERITVREYTKPDSTGKQYVVKETTIEKKHGQKNRSFY
ncbi:MAG: hypothetical protein HC896_00005 [Bacteroidales bacterium]|nr:hypothetical protein [Bacteroidales bacterium]